MIVFEGQFFEALKDLGFSSELWVFAIPVALMIIDFITGFVNAWAKHEIKSYKMRVGLGKKIGEISILAIGEMLTVGMGLPPYIMKWLAVYIMIMELISICENLAKLNVPIPGFIKKALNDANDAIVNGELVTDKK